MPIALVSDVTYILGLFGVRNIVFLPKIVSALFIHNRIDFLLEILNKGLLE